MKKTLSHLPVFFLLALFSDVSALEHIEEMDSTWKAGIAKANIIPEQYIWMGGYAFRNHPAEGKVTDLWAKALALEDANGQKAVIVTIGLVGISRALSDKINPT